MTYNDDQSLSNQHYGFHEMLSLVITLAIAVLCGILSPVITLPRCEPPVKSSPLPPLPPLSMYHEH